eukprot:3083092-Prorocentrum_lima.AAC.1
MMVTVADNADTLLLGGPVGSAGTPIAGFLLSKVSMATGTEAELKSCLSTADENAANNQEVYNWDYGIDNFGGAAPTPSEFMHA